MGTLPLTYEAGDPSLLQPLTSGSMVATMDAKNRILQGAKVTGSEGYEAFMRRSQPPTPDTAWFCSKIPIWLLSMLSIVDTCPVAAERQGVREMFLALKKSAESSVNEPIFFAAIAMDGVWTVPPETPALIEYFESTFKQALEEVG